MPLPPHLRATEKATSLRAARGNVAKAKSLSKGNVEVRAPREDVDMVERGEESSGSESDRSMSV
eukprot:5844367-Karenia_brevis.AAC.1